MQFLARESCDFAVVGALRTAGYDVMAVTEQLSGISDLEVIDLARVEHRVVLTEDKDFGQLVVSALAGLGRGDPDSLSRDRSQWSPIDHTLEIARSNVGCGPRKSQSSNSRSALAPTGGSIPE